MGRRVHRFRLIQFTRLVGIVFVGGGFAAIGLGWNGMAQLTCVDCQLPYLLSGGAAGLGLIVLGAALLVIAQVRAERIRILHELERREQVQTPAEPDHVTTDDLDLGERSPIGAPRRS